MLSRNHLLLRISGVLGAHLLVFRHGLSSVPQQQTFLFNFMNSRVILSLLLALVCVSCAGPKVARNTKETTIKAPALSEVLITVTRDDLTVSIKPVPWWQAALQGLTGGIVNAFTKPKPEPLL